MTKRLIAVLTVVISATSLLHAYDAPLAAVRNLDCAFKRATRFDQSAITQGSSEGPTAYVKIVATGSLRGTCDVRASLYIKVPDENETEFAVGHNTDAGFEIVDWSPGGNLILVAREHWTEVFSAPLITVYNARENTHSKVDITALFASRGWAQCSAIVEATGFAPNGEIVVHIEPGSLQNRQGTARPLSRTGRLI